jgi:hypothetical protein
MTFNNILEILVWFFLGAQAIGLFIYASKVLTAKNLEATGWEASAIFAISQTFTSIYCIYHHVPIIIIIYNLYAGFLEFLIVIKVLKTK